MKHLLAWLGGLLVGITLAGVVLWFNPLVGESRQPVTLDGPRTAEYFADLSPGSTLMLTHDGRRRLPVRPEQVGELWERPVRGTVASVVLLRDDSGTPVGVASRIGGYSSDTDPLRRGALLDTHWLLSLPGEGIAVVTQRENFWPMLRAVALPSMVQRQAWSGELELLPAAGPRDSRAAQVVGVAGALDGRRGSLVATYRLEAFDPSLGPTSLATRVILSLPASPEGGDAGPEAEPEEAPGQTDDSTGGTQDVPATAVPAESPG